jgi:hypothetical protein
MRAYEFLAEKRAGRLSNRQHRSSVGLTRFTDASGVDRIYDLNRVMMAVSMADGTDAALQVDAASWSGKYNIAAPYTKEEENMLKQAFKAVGVQSDDLNNGDLRSQELESTNTLSPVVGFKGYP